MSINLAVRKADGTPKEKERKLAELFPGHLTPEADAALRGL